MVSSSKRKDKVCDSGESGGTSKEKRRVQEFRPKYEEDWPFIKPGKKGQTFAFCDICVCDIGISSGGHNDIKRHVGTEKHKTNAKRRKEEANNQITGFFVQKQSDKSEDSGVIRAEVMMTDLVVELNLPLAAMDKFNKAVKVMFPDSKIVKGFQCARSKTTAIVKEIAAQTTLTLAERMKNAPFTISTVIVSIHLSKR